MEIQYKDGLLFTSIQIHFHGCAKLIDNIFVATGAVSTIMSPDVVNDIEIIAELKHSLDSFFGIGGTLHNCFSKNVNTIAIGQAH